MAADTRHRLTAYATKEEVRSEALAYLKIVQNSVKLGVSFRDSNPVSVPSKTKHPVNLKQNNQVVRLLSVVFVLPIFG